jgi:hypothetical protein
MSIYASGKDAISRGPCKPVALPGLEAGTYFVLLRNAERPSDVAVRAVQQH